MLKPRYHCIYEASAGCSLAACESAVKSSISPDGLQMHILLTLQLCVLWLCCTAGLYSSLKLIPAAELREPSFPSSLFCIRGALANERIFFLFRAKAFTNPTLTVKIITQGFDTNTSLKFCSGEVDLTPWILICVEWSCQSEWRRIQNEKQKTMKNWLSSKLGCNLPAALRKDQNKLYFTFLPFN